MSDSPMQLALRDWRADMTRQQTVVVLAAVGAVVALVGPFGTAEALRLLPRLVYWSALVALTYGVGNLINRLCAPLRFGLPLAIGATTGVVSALVLSLNALVFGVVPDWEALLPFVATILGISGVITLTARYLTGSDSAAQPPALLARLPIQARGALVSLSAEDHYTRVRTTSGEALVLIRLTDAIAECAPTAGLRVHRSHWVALAQVTAATRDGDRARLTLTHGPAIPVSRANIPQIKEAGLLPARI